jgi:hypothetical protein
MTGRDLRSFVVDLQRFRPLATVVLAVGMVLPSLWELGTGGLSALTFLARLALALPVCAALVWAVSWVVLRYARMQAPPKGAGEQFHPTPADFDR